MAKKWIGYIGVGSLMCAALGCGILYTRQARLQQTISDKVLRFHVLANSDSEADQNLKLAVRDAVGSFMQEKMAAVPRMKMVVGGKEYTVSMVGKLLSYTDMKEDSSLENIDMAYIYTPDGINLYEPLTVNGITFQRLVYDDATGAIKATDADVSFPYPTALEQFCGTTSQWYLSFDIAAGTGDMDKELMDLFSNAYAINKSTQYEEFIGWYIGANSAYPGNDTNPYCMGWESNWLGLQVWDVAYGYKMSIIDEASKKISLQSTAPGINYDFYVFLDPIIEYVDAHSPYTVEFDDDQTPTTTKLVSTVDNKVWFSLTKQ